MVALRTPYSGFEIDVPDFLVKRYTDAGYKPADGAKKSTTTRAKRAPSKAADEPKGEE